MSAALTLEREEEAPVCITAKLRAEIRARDWAKCHVEGDRAEPLKIGERKKWKWR